MVQPLEVIRAKVSLNDKTIFLHDLRASCLGRAVRCDDVRK